jgi:hypothetical protein
MSVPIKTPNRRINNDRFAAGYAGRYPSQV